MIRKKLLIFSALLIAVLLAASFLVLSLLSSPLLSKYEKISRNFELQEEENALTVAESINYSNIVSLERFDGSSDPQDYLEPRTYLSYTYANFIDSEIIEYYQTRYDNLEKKWEPKGIGLNYEANSTKRSEFRVFNSPAPEGVTWHNITIVLSEPDGSVRLKHSGNMPFFYWNQSGYQKVEWEYDFNFSDCYVVEMELSYSEFYAPTAGFISEVYQIIVLDRDFTPILIGVEYNKVIS